MKKSQESGHRYYIQGNVCPLKTHLLHKEAVFPQKGFIDRLLTGVYRSFLHGCPLCARRTAGISRRALSVRATLAFRLDFLTFQCAFLYVRSQDLSWDTERGTLMAPTRIIDFSTSFSLLTF